MDLVKELATLARTGHLGPAHYGALLPDLLAAYGEPRSAGRVQPEHRWPHWFCFGSLEVYFCQCRRLEYLSIPVWHDGLEIPGPQPGELRTVDSHITESTLTAALTAAGCRWRTVQYENLHDQRTLEVDAADGACVSFVLTDRESYDAPVLDDWILYKAGLRGHTHEQCPPLDPVVDLPGA